MRANRIYFEVTNSPELALGEGVPYLIDRYRTKSANGAVELQTHEMPWLRGTWPDLYRQVGLCESTSENSWITGKTETEASTQRYQGSSVKLRTFAFTH